MDTLKKLKVVELKQILRENGLRVGGTKSELISRILENNSLYENDIKTSPVYIQKGMTTKQTVPQLKALLKSYGLKVSGRKADLIERLNAYSGDVGTKKISRKEIKPYEKMLVADLKAILKKLKLKVMGRKADLVARLYEYDKSREQKEMDMMGIEDIQAYKKDFIEKSKAQLERQTKEIEEKIKRDLNPTPIKMSREEIEKQIEINNARLIELRKDFEQGIIRQKKDEKTREQKEIESMGMEDIPINEAIPIADVYIPMPSEDIQRAEPIDSLWSREHYYGDYIGRKYHPADVFQLLRRERNEAEGIFDGNTGNQVRRTIPLQLNQILNVLPIDSVRRVLQSTNENLVQFVSEFGVMEYTIDDLKEELIATKLYDMTGWKYNIIKHDPGYKWALVYYRVLPKDMLIDYIRQYDGIIRKMLKDVLWSTFAVQLVLEDLGGYVYERDYQEISTDIDGWETALLVYNRTSGTVSINFRRNKDLTKRREVQVFNLSNGKIIKGEPVDTSIRETVLGGDSNNPLNNEI